jgi:hypothetical protein
MPSWKKVLISGSDAALNSLNITTALTASGITYPSSDGTSGQVLITNGSGQLAFSTISSGGTGSSVKLVQTTPASTWTFTHNLNEKFPAVTIYNENDEVIVPAKIEAQDDNTLIIYFSSLRTGTAAAVVGGSTVSASYASNALTASYAVTASYALFAETPTVQGAQGTTGAQGATGLQGTDGYIGVDGVQGIQGRQGIQGIAGFLGSDGAQGTTGTQGTAGLQGTQGTTGSQGTSGIQGITGIRGASDWTPVLTGMEQSSTNSQTYTKTASNNQWNAQVHSQQGFIRGVYASARFSSNAQASAFGLDTSPASSLDPATIDYSFLTNGGGTLYIVENGVNHFGGTYTTTDTLLITYDGFNVRYFQNSTLLRTVGRSIGLPLFFDAAIYQTSRSIDSVIFGPMGESGPQGTQGIQGIQGTNGVQGLTGTQGVQGTAGNTGLGFTIAKTYISVAALEADITPSGIITGQFALIDTGDVEDADNSKLYLWNGSAYVFVNDLSGTAGIQGITGQTGIQGTTGTQGVQGIQGVNAGITSYTNPGDNRIITSVDGTTINAESNLSFDGSILSVTGSVISTQGFTGSLQGNADTATTASYALTASYLPNPTVSGSINEIGILSFTTGSEYVLDAAQIAWNPIDGTFDMGLLSGVSLQVGQELHFYGKAVGTIANGDAVMFAGSQGDHLLMTKATQATINSNPEYFIGVATQAFTNNQFGYVTVLGKVRGLDTLSYSQGAVLYFDSEGSTAGALTATKPVAPNAKIEVAAVVRVHGTEGIIMVRPHVMPFLADLHDIGINNVVHGDLLIRSGSVWTNSKQLSGSYAVTGSITATSFIKAGGTAEQYLRADGSVSTALTSRIEDNFIATAGQTTFPLTYEVGQLEIYYNGSKLYPDEFTATNGTSVVLATGATEGAQISTVKYVAALTTAAVRNETTFTTTLNQTTFNVNYTPGQLDVFYNGAKLNVSEFTATNGTSVVLGFPCAADESVAIISYVNQVSGASGTSGYLSKFTGAASLGDSAIFQSGSNIGIGTTNPSTKLEVNSSDLNNIFVTNPDTSGTTTGSGIGFKAYNGTSVAQSAGIILTANSWNYGTYSANQLSIGVDGAGGLALRSANSAPISFFTGGTTAGLSTERLRIASNGDIYANSGAAFFFGLSALTYIAGGNTSISLAVNGSDRININSSGKVGIGTTDPTALLHLSTAAGTGTSILKLANTSGASASNIVRQEFIIGNSFGGAETVAYITALNPNATANNGGALTFSTSANGTGTTPTERMRINSSGNVGIGTDNATDRLTIKGPGNYVGISIDNGGATGGCYYTVKQNGVSSGFFGGSGAALGDTSSDLALFAETGKSIRFYTGGSSTESMRITSGGNVGIGFSSSFTSKLEVNGSIAFAYSEGIKARGYAYESVMMTTYDSYWGDVVNFYTAGNGTHNANRKLTLAGGGAVIVYSLGTGTVYSNAGVLTNSNPSDRRLKDEITDLPYGLNEILQLRPVTYLWKNDTINQGKQFGFIAQEVQEIMPDLVKEFETKDGEEDVIRLGLDKEAIFVAMVNAFKQQQEQIQELKAEIEILKNK